MMMTLNMERGALITRDAYSAFLELKHVVEQATEQMHEAEREAVGLAIGKSPTADPLRPLKAAALALQSPEFEAAVSEARAKTETAMAWHLGEHA
jgi:hypothetical protein